MTGQSQPTNGGVFLTKNQQLMIRELKTMISPDGEITGTVNVQVAYNMVPPWFLSALAHLRTCRDANSRRIAAHATRDQTELGVSIPVALRTFLLSSERAARSNRTSSGLLSGR
jgi:hypothetical protein